MNSQNVMAKVDILNSKVLVMPEKIMDQVFTDYLTVEVLPNSITPGEKADVILSKVADNGLSLYWAKSPLRESKVGRAAASVEKKLNFDAQYEDQQKIKHKFNLKFLAIQSLAKLEYMGWVKATINYDVKAEQSEAEVVDQLSPYNEMIISHSINNLEQTSKISMRWQW